MRQLKKMTDEIKDVCEECSWEIEDIISDVSLICKCDECGNRAFFELRNHI